MPIVVAWIGEMLLNTIGQMVLSGMVALGIGFLVSKGATGVIDMTEIQSKLAAAGPMLAWIGVLRIDQSITVILSAWAGRAITDAAKTHLAIKKKAAE
jgi:hypothetical protein